MGTLASLLRYDGTAWHAERDSGMLDLVFDSEGRLWGQGKTGFHWRESGQWRERPFLPFREYGMNTVHALAADASGNVLFQHTLCGAMFCGMFSTPPTEMGYVTPDTLVIGNADFPARPATSIAVDENGWPWIGTGGGSMPGLFFPGRRIGSGAGAGWRDVSGRRTLGRSMGVRAALP